MPYQSFERQHRGSFCPEVKPSSLKRMMCAPALLMIIFANYGRQDAPQKHIDNATLHLSPFRCFMGETLRLVSWTLRAFLNVVRW